MSEADQFVRRVTKRSAIFAVAFVSGLFLLATTMGSAPPSKPESDCCKQCKCPDCPGNALPRPPAVQTPAPKPKAQPVPMSFEEALRDQIESRPETIRSKRILAVLDMEDGPRRDRILHRMERHAALHLDLKGEVGQIDWSSIDWAKLFDQIIKLLTALLPLLLAL